MSQEITLSTLETVNPLVVFQAGGMSSILSAIRSEVLSNLPDTSTDKGRKEIAKNAHKVAKSKVLLDTLGKQLADDLNAQLKPINAERKIARDTLDDLKCEVRQPLTEWEQDQAQIKAEAEAVEASEKLAIQVGADYEMAALMDGEFNRQSDAKLKADKKAKADYEEQLKSEAAAQAKLQAETAAKALIDKAEADKLAAEQAAADQITRAKVAAENAEAERISALKKAETDKQAAILNEQARQAAEKEAERVATEKREKNRAHVGVIRKLAKEHLMLIDGVDEAIAKAIVMAISNGNVAHTQITY
jgi:hypothetical protein|tara:strand:+ start:50 stop:964 length:915 start_codon:yes stop_codon:yes gene_type:complete